MSYATYGINSTKPGYQNINEPPPANRVPVKIQSANFNDNVENNSIQQSQLQPNILSSLNNQEILVNYAASLRNSIVEKNNNSLDIDTKLFYAMDFISQKITTNNLFVDEVIDLYQQIEQAVKKGVNTDGSSNKQYLIQEFLITCIALTNQVKFTNSSLSSMLIAQLNNVSKQTIARNLADNNQDNLENSAWKIITNSVSVETMLQFDFNSKQIIKQQKKPRKPVNAVNAKKNGENNSNRQKPLKSEAEDNDLQELKFIQARHQKILDSYSKNISLIWFAPNTTQTQMPQNYLWAMQTQLKFFRQFKQPIKITLLTDYLTFKSNRNKLITLVKTYGDRFEIEFIEDIFFQDHDIQKVHEYFLKQQYDGDPRKASKFYQVAFNLENSISPELHHNIYFSFNQLFILSQENIWDKIKRLLHLEKNKLITLLKKLLKYKGTSTINGNKFLYVPEMNIKKTILQRNTQR